MILIADSGSSTTEWYLIRKGLQGTAIQTDGLNPYFVGADKVDTILQKELLPLMYPEKVEQLIFYGAGCARESKQYVLSDVFRDYFTRADIEIYPDILGTARSLFADQRGIAGILGTGANLCLYGGRNIEIQPPSLGYILGDEGSGASLGLTLLRAYIRQELPADIKESFDKRYQLETSTILDAIYQQPHPNRWAAGFALFLKQNIENEFIRNLVLNNFRYFVVKNLLAFKEHHVLPIGFTGSVAFHFQDLLKTATSEQGIEISMVLASPIEGLVRYHTPSDWIV
ncbi:MAG: hypothetical protein NTU44_14555 [Bacteroidetes bacterium]|nr:hypothetical protein [Bacteroidota bacterium]